MFKFIKKKRTLLILIILFLCIFTISFYNKQNNIQSVSAEIDNNDSEWKTDLYTPTMIQKINDTYFIVDCWHHRIIYNNNLTDNITKWNTLTDEIKGGHTIASDGQVYLTDDTDNSLIRVFVKNGTTFNQIQALENIDARPHYILYDETTKYFYCISSGSGKMWTLKNENGVVKIVNTFVINEITNSYVRSFNIIDGYMYLSSGPGYIYKVKYDDLSYKVIDKYQVPPDMIGMNYITKIADYFYISSYTNSKGEIAPKFVRIKDLKDLESNKYENLYDKFDFKGTPYYISSFDNKYFIAEIDASSGIKSFEVNNNEISNIQTLYYFEGHSNSSEERKQSKYK
ncbi:hypothetical protein CLPUN_17130 [Clostridium puniceum]|uniref:DUF5050 domain-containing protein n=1 Tax=Clostridium puniceum TaxID=29367 RepID=A0A1S8TMS8_9CLOT|nr:hypothetical protein [Clostridium puniceum]OOM78986.1 hypothetical protein CLPUN_17130 [Clostridium puniceum]